MNAAVRELKKPLLMRHVLTDQRISCAYIELCVTGVRPLIDTILPLTLYPPTLNLRVLAGYQCIPKLFVCEMTLNVHFAGEITKL